jgi:hypothetical protein
VGPTAAGQARCDQHGRGQGHGDPLPLALLLGPCLGRDPRQLGCPEPFLHPDLVGRHPPGYRARIPRPIPGLRRQAVAGQGDQLGVGPAGIEPSECAGQIAPRGSGAGPFSRRAPERRPAGEDLAEDGSQAEDVGPLIDPVELAPGLLGRHVRGGPQDAARLRLGAA